MSIQRRPWSLGYIVAFAATLFLALPSSCSRSPVVREGKPEKQGESAAQPVSFLPHPAFAQGRGAADATDLSDIAARATPSVVNIASSKMVRSSENRLPFFDDPMFRRFFEGPMPEEPGERREHGLGSGVVVSKDGIVLTNHHVIDKADEITVITPDRREFEAKVIGSDPKSDLAVLRMKGDPSGLRPIEFADSSRARLGDVVLAIGNPFGLGQTVTMGIVSAKGRANVGITDYEDFIQTDAAINPGNSGGALIDMEGKMLGINTAILSRTGGNQGIGFAIPSDMARPIMDSLIKTGKVQRGWLGVVIQDVDQSLAQALGMKNARGVLISDVSEDGPAAKAGLRRGDVILSIDGAPTTSSGQLRNLVAAAGVGKKVTLEVLRDGKKREITAVLAEQPAELQAPGAAPNEPLRNERLQGLTVVPLVPATRQRFGIDASIQSGVVVADVESNSPAAQAGVRPGDVIVEVNRKPVSSPNELIAALEPAKKDAPTLLLVNRDGVTLFLTLPVQD